MGELRQRPGPGKPDDNEKPAAPASDKPAGPSPLNFSAHLRDVFQPRRSGFSALDGVRAILSIWVVAFHSNSYMSHFVPDADFENASKHPLLALYMLGPTAVDGFFVLTGFLLAYPLLDGLRKGKPAPNVKEWWYRRVARMLPIYALMLLVWCRGFFGEIMIPIQNLKSEFHQEAAALVPGAPGYPTNAALAWGNLAFVNNLLPFGGCMGHTWSLAIQFQFYLLLPVAFALLARRGHRALAAFFAVLCVLSVASRVLAFYQNIMFKPKTVEAFFFVFFWYSSTLARFGPIAMGALLAYVVVFTDWAERAKKHAWVRLAGWALVAATLVANMQWSSWFGTGERNGAPGITSIVQGHDGVHHMLFYVLANVGGPLMGFLYCWIVFVAIKSVGRTGAALNKFFSSSVWYPLSQVSYMSYLMHPALMLRLYQDGVFGMDLWVGWVLARAAAFVVLAHAWGLLAHVLLERPIDAWLRRRERPFLAKATYVYCIGIWALNILQSLITYALVCRMLPAQPHPNYHGPLSVDSPFAEFATRAAA